MSRWDIRFLRLAEHVSEWSKDPSTKVGAVIATPENRLVSIGYNGFPRGVPDEPALLKNRDLKYARVVHAEINALLFANAPLKGCTLYTYPLLCCSQCASIVINSGISRIVSIVSFNARWVESISVSQTLFHAAEIPITFYEKDALCQINGMKNTKKNFTEK